MELVGPSYRMIAGIALELFWACGAIVLALLAYLIRDWRYLNLAVSLPALLFIPYVWWVALTSYVLLPTVYNNTMVFIFVLVSATQKKNTKKTIQNKEGSFSNLCSCVTSLKGVSGLRFVAVGKGWGVDTKPSVAYCNSRDVFFCIFTAGNLHQLPSPNYYALQLSFDSLRNYIIKLIGSYYEYNVLIYYPAYYLN